MKKLAYLKMVAVPIYMTSALCLLFLSHAYAAAEITLAGGGWDLGAKGASSESASAANTWTITNDSGGQEDVLIKVTGGSPWVASTDGTQIADKFVLRKDNSSGQIITGTDANLVTSLAKNGTHSFGLYFKAPPTGSSEGAKTLAVTLTAKNWQLQCGDPFTINHVAGVISPSTVNITYGTVLTNLTGADKCWITRNLGATQQATSATDATDASAGWYWQFNRKQGYAVGPSPAWGGSTINESFNWQAANDPCTLLIGAGWRIPTYTEWLNADANGAWGNYGNTYASVLKLHAAGYLYYTDGALYSRGSHGYYWSSTQSSSANGYLLYFYSGNSYMLDLNKAYGFSVRCIRD
mgnify:CR=1 FL=1